MNERQRLTDTFGGTWDGASPEIHGLIEADPDMLSTDKLKVELLFSGVRKIWSCSVFYQGACVGQASSEDTVAAVRHALQNV